MLKAPNYTNRTPEEIITQNIYFDSVGFIYRSLSWISVAKSNRNICALQYAALDCRHGIEQLLFEELVLSVGTELDENEYKKCRGNSTRLHKIIKRLNPDYEKLAKFTQAIMSTDVNIPPLKIWDHNKLMKYWGKVSSYLHWSGAPKDTYESTPWFEEGLNIIEEASLHIWENKIRGFTAIMRPENMSPEIHDAWLKYKEGKLNIQGVKRIADLALPILARRKKA